MYSHRIAFVLTVALSLQGGCASDDEERIDPAADADVEDAADAGPPKEFGEACSVSAECADGFCAQGRCSVGCMPSDINSCVDHDAMCVALASIPGGCFGGPLSLGDDLDDNKEVSVGQSFVQSLGVGDADLFKMETDPAGGALWLEVAAVAGLDVAFDVYTNRGDMWLTVDDESAGGTERAELSPEVPAPDMFVVVRNAGDQAGEYTLGWACNLSDCTAR